MIIGVSVALVLVIYMIFLFQNNMTKNTFIILEDNNTPQVSEYNNIIWLAKNHNGLEDRIGWIGNGILVNYMAITPDATVYIYYPEQGKKEFIVSHGDYYGKFMGQTEIKPFVLNEQKILLYYNYIENPILQLQLNNIKFTQKDYSYSYVEETVPKDNVFRKNIEEYAEKSESKDIEAKSMIKIYDLKSRKLEKVFEYKNKYRTTGSEDHIPIISLQSVGYSNNSMYIAWCVENELGEFLFSIYNVNSKTERKYKTIEGQERFDCIESLSVSNDGNTIWFIGKPKANYMGSIYKKGNNIFRMDMNKKNEPELIAEDVISYKTSFDDRYIIYDKLKKDNEEKTGTLSCMNLLTMEEVSIDENIISCLPKGFDLSLSDNKFTYLKKNDNGAQIYVGKLDDKTYKPRLIGKLPDIANVKCVDFGENNNNLLVSYYYILNKKHVYNTCVIKIN